MFVDLSACLLTCLYVCSPGKTFNMYVSDWDYLRILHEGNFISFVCMVLDKDKKVSVLATEEIRLKVSLSKLQSFRGK